MIDVMFTAVYYNKLNFEIKGECSFKRKNQCLMSGGCV